MNNTLKALVLAASAGLVLAGPAASAQTAVMAGCNANVLTDVVSANVPILSPGASECLTKVSSTKA
ncbi:hypothetical protein ABGB18_05735 [Nonomuraea sp. B12E4]|uniref:hypothetical protein n=1 Tax=Nonomuraea sp. B12E4 TaxID=3153564 RepID=UPI00325DC62F